jgi:hypothetical protein
MSFSQGQTSLADFPHLATEWDSNHPRARAVTAALTKMICADFQPFSLVTDSGFRSFVKSLEPRYKLPTRQKLSKELIPDLYNATKSHIKSMMNGDEKLKLSSVSITTDGWTSATNDSYISFTAHFMDTSFKVHNLCLAVEYFPDSHTADHIACAIDNCLKQWLSASSLSKAQVFVITDNAANMKAALKQLPETVHLTCFAHTLQLVVQTAVKSCPSLVNLSSKAKSIVRYFHHSPRASHNLLGAQIQLKLLQHKLKNECATRWNSTYHMLDRLVEQKDAISLVLASNEQVSSLSANEWRMAADYVSSLEPFEEATTLMSGSRYPTSSMVIPVLNILYRNMDKPAGLQILKKALIDGMNKRWPDHDTMFPFALATLLDPRFKRYAFRKEESYMKAFDEVVSAAMNIEHPELEGSNASGTGTGTGTSSQRAHTVTAHVTIAAQQVSSEASSSDTDSKTSSSTSIIWGTYKNMVAEQQQAIALANEDSLKDTIEQELRSYLREPIIDPDGNVNAFDWWATHSARYPLIAKVARKVLAIPATSVPSEQLFSKAGQIVTDRRSRLSPEHTEQLTFLCHNLRHTNLE